MYCKKCGAKIREGVKYCPRCGTAIAKRSCNGKTNKYLSSIDMKSANKKSEGTNLRKKRKTWKLIVPIVLAIVVVAVGGYYVCKYTDFLNPNDDQTEETATSISADDSQTATEEIEESKTDDIEDKEETESKVNDESMPETEGSTTESSDDNSVLLTDETEANADLYPRPERTLQYQSVSIMSGDDVKYVQAALIEMNYSNLSVNGYYDSNTYSAVKRFQKNHNYTQNGVVDAQMVSNIATTLDEWRESQANAPALTGITTVNADLYPIPERKLYYNSTTTISGEDVKYVQSALIEMNYTGISVTGTYDSATASAVKRFQTNHNLTVDGIVGDETTNALQEYLAIWRQKH